MLLLPVALVSLTAGCATFSDNNVAVRVDDTSYSYDDLDTLTGAIGMPENELESIRSFATDLVLVGAIENWLADADTPITEDDRKFGLEQAQINVAGFAELDESRQAIFIDFFAVIDRAGTLPDIQTAVIEAVANADVHIDPQIGTFDSVANAVVPLG